MHRSIVPTVCLAAAAAVAFTATPTQAEEVVLYDLDFTMHQFFQPPQEGVGGPPRDTVSHINEGSPHIDVDYLNIGHKPCVFEDQESFRLWFFNGLPEGDEYDIEFDIVVSEDSINPMTIELFAPDQRTFFVDAEISNLWYIGPNGFISLGAFVKGVPMHVRMWYHLDSNLFAIWVDDVLYYFDGSEEWGPLEQIEFGNPGPNVTSAVDNIRVIANVPPPACPDLNGDNTVDSADLSELLAQWGDCDGCDADFDFDGQVTSADLTQILAAWGPCGN